MVIDTVRREAVAWTAMDRWAVFVDALMERHQAMESRSEHHTGLTNLLLELAEKGRLSREDEEDVRASTVNKRKVSRVLNLPILTSQESTISTGGVSAEILSDLRDAIAEGDHRALTLISAKLFARGPFAHWSTLWWANVTLGLQVDVSNSSTIISSAISHVIEVAHRSGETTNATFTAWLEGMSPSARFDLLAQPSAICTFVLNLAAQRQIHLVPIFDKLAYLVWKEVATSALTSKGRINHARAVSSTVTLAQQLLLSSPPNRTLSPTNICEALIIQTARTEIFNNINIKSLIRHLPFLVVLETSRGMPSEIRGQISTFLQSLAMSSEFKAAVFRHPDLLKEVFLSNEWSKPTLDPLLETGMVDTLKLIMPDGSSKYLTRQNS